MKIDLEVLSLDSGSSAHQNTDPAEVCFFKICEMRLNLVITHFWFVAGCKTESPV